MSQNDFSAFTGCQAPGVNSSGSFNNFLKLIFAKVGFYIWSCQQYLQEGSLFQSLILTYVVINTIFLGPKRDSHTDFSEFCLLLYLPILKCLFGLEMAGYMTYFRIKIVKPHMARYQTFFSLWASKAPRASMWISKAVFRWIWNVDDPHMLSNICDHEPQLPQGYICLQWKKCSVKNKVNHE